MKLTHLLLVLCLMLGVVLCYPWYGNSKESSKSYACLSHLKQQALALNEYASDHDGRYPSRDVWMDATRLYAPAPAPAPAERCPALPTGSYGYAFNARLSAGREPRFPETVPIVYDSVDPIRNASDQVASLPVKGRHVGKNSIAYADGHARRVAP